jgi:uncharacterized membrane-anchored protein
MIFDDELKNKYIFQERCEKGKELLEKWHPKIYKKIIERIEPYNLAVLGSISIDVINAEGLDTFEQIVKLINSYSSQPIVEKPTKNQLQTKSLYLIKKWNPDSYEDILNKLTDKELVSLATADKKIIEYYGLDSVESIRICIKLSEKSKNSNQKVEFFDGNTNEFLYNTFISYMRMKHNLVITEINIDNFDYYFFDDLLDKMTDLFINHSKKINYKL